MFDKFKMFSLISFFIILTVLVGACNSSQNVESQNNNDSVEEISGDLVVTSYGGQAREWFVEILGGYEEEYPEVNIELDVGLAADWTTKLIAHEDGSPPIDVLKTTDTNAHHVSNNGMALELTEDKIPNLKDVPDKFRFDDSVGFWYSPMVIAYRTDEVDNPPTSWEDLWNPEYRDHTLGIFSSSNTGSLLFLALVSKIFTGDEYNLDEALEKVSEIQPFRQSDLDLDIVNMIVNNEVQIAILEKGAFLDLQSQGYPIEAVDPKEGTFGFIQTLLAIKDTENEEAAYELINYLLDIGAQEQFWELMYKIPVNENIPENMYSEMDVEGVNLLEWDWDFLNENRQEIMRKWDEEFAQQ